MRISITAGLLSLFVVSGVSGCGLLDSSAPPPPAAPALPVPATPAAAPLSVVGLVDGTSLVRFGTDDVSLRDSRPVTGLTGDDEKLVGIDYRVQDGKLYGVGDAGGVYSIDDAGAATKVKQLTVKLNGENFGVDFNPAANALRIISDTGQNLRQPFADLAAATANDGALTNPAVAPATAATPAKGAASAGYTNNDDDKATATALFVIDTEADRVSIQSPANAGTFAPMGGLGVDAAEQAGFDIYQGAGDPGAAPTALATLQVNGGYGLYEVNLLTGKADSMGDLAGNVTDIAIPLVQQ